MKKAALILVLGFAGFIGNAQEINEANHELLYQDKIENVKNLPTGDIVLDISVDNDLVLSSLDENTNFVVSAHEFSHEEFSISEIFDIRTGAYSLNEYAVNYKPETISKETI